MDGWWIGAWMVEEGVMDGQRDTWQMEKGMYDRIEPWQVDGGREDGWVDRWLDG
jgi:hypothetical protein